MVTPRDGQAPAQTTKDRLLDAAVRFVRDRGVIGWSLRELATFAGTSHAHLLYHFGNREQLLVDVMLEIRRRDRLDFAAEVGEVDLSAYLIDGFRFLTDDTHIADMRTFFYVAGLALQDPSMSRFFTDVVSGYVDVQGETPTQRARRRVALAGMRGLLLDLLATGDRAGVEDALAELALLLRGRDHR